jgi:hypothetical protein
MPATPDRIGFITQPYRKAPTTVDATVEGAYGELARETDIDEPIETLFDSMTDAQAMADERLVLLKGERARFQIALPNALSFGLALDYSQQTPTATVIDPERDTNRPALVTDIGFDFRRGGVTMGLWG